MQEISAATHSIFRKLKPFQFVVSFFCQRRQTVQTERNTEVRKDNDTDG